MCIRDRTRVAHEVKIPIIGIGAGGGVDGQVLVLHDMLGICLLYTSPSPRDRTRSRMPSSA